MKKDVVNGECRIYRMSYMPDKNTCRDKKILGTDGYMSYIWQIVAYAGYDCITPFIAHDVPFI